MVCMRRMIMGIGYGLYEDDDNHENRIWFV